MTSKMVGPEEIAELKELQAKENPSLADYARMTQIEHRCMIHGIEGLEAQPFDGLMPRDEAVNFANIMWFFTTLLHGDGKVTNHNHVTEVTTVSEPCFPNYPVTPTKNAVFCTGEFDTQFEWGCDHCRNDGELIDNGMTPRCPVCDAEFPDEG
jgi:hypothetical protein